MGVTRAIIAAFGIGLIMGATAGCNQPPTVVGSWKGTLFQQDVLAEFKTDKSLTLNVKAAEMGANLNGTYTVDPKTLTIAVEDYKLQNVPDTLAPLAKKIFDPLKGKSYAIAYHFNSQNELALTYQGRADVLKRVVADQ